MSNYYKVEQLTEQNTTSTTFVNVPGTTLMFTPEDTGQIWMIFVSGSCRSSSTVEQSHEIILSINDVEHDLWSHQITNTAATEGGGFLIFDRITGVNTEQTVKVQFRSLNGVCYASQIRVIAALVPDGADFQYLNNDAIVSTTGTDIDIMTFTFSPSSAGDYIILGSVKHREHPSGSTSQVRFVGSDGTQHPNATSGIYHSNAREPWNPTTYVWRETLTTGSKSFYTRFISSNSGSQASEHRYRKYMAFRVDAWDLVESNFSTAKSTTTSSGFQQKNVVVAAAPPEAQDYLSIQAARISGATTSATIQKSGELRIDGTPLMRTNHTISRDGSATQGYHHTVGLVDVRNTSSSLSYQNGYLSPDAATIEIAESGIVVLRYPTVSVEGYHMII